MPDRPIVDVHAHVSENAAIGERSTAAYEIWEYGDKPDVAFGHASGTIADLLEAMRARGARGIKLHPNEQRCFPSDPRLLRVWRACAGLGLTVLSHSGPDRDGLGFAEPSAFAAVLETVPEVRLVVAHLGGASWDDARSLAERYPSVSFDMSEIVAWVGAPNAPDPDELVALVRNVGVDRVLFGSDFPWYDPGEMAGVVRRLPGLRDGEIDAILGENAVRILELPI